MARTISEEIKQEWKEKILNQRNSGLTIASWCSQNKVAVHTFYYWRNKLFPKAITRAAFKEVAHEKEISRAGVVLEYKGCHIHLTQYFDHEVLERCLQVLQKC